MGLARARAPEIQEIEKTYSQESFKKLFQHFYDKAIAFGASQEDAQELAENATARLKVEDTESAA